MLESFKTCEAFKYKRLTEEEQRNRKILGRLSGVIADTNEETRNGRRYGLELWQNVFNDPIMKEKIANRCVFSELGHPTDREEIDMSKVCACLAEQPKLGDDGKVYGVFDILDLPNGRILKTLCDYGCNIGVSSRGSGDVMSNGDVDPETYNCECFDMVVIPAVKSARLQYVTESLNSNKKTLKQALLESYNKANEEDKKVMRETMDGLGDVLVDEDVPMGSDPDAVVEEDETDVEDIEDAETAEEGEDTDESPIGTVDDFIKELKDFDKKLNVKVAPIKIGDTEYSINSIDFDDETEDGALTINFVCDQETGDDIEDAEAEENEDEADADVADEEKSEDEPETDEEAEDNGSKEVLESLKTIVRQKDLLENELKSLKKKRAVSDTEVNELKEELNKYKSAFARTSKIAANAKKLTLENNELTEQLNRKNKEIKNLKANNSEKLSEGVETSKKQVMQLKEQLKAKNYELEATEETAKKQTEAYKRKLNESVKIAESYKKQCNEAINKYISFRASMLGVKPAEIINRLNEQYSISDIDDICENILSESMSVNSLTRSIGSNSRVKIQESKDCTKKSPEYGYDIDDDLLTLAGLK